MPRAVSHTQPQTLDEHALPVPGAHATGAFIGLAVGDALGATVEFMTPREIAERHGKHREIIGGGWLRLPRGQITDDTGMALALGNSILSKGRIEPAAIAEAFSEWMRRKPIDIGNTVRRGIVQYRQTGATEVAPNELDAGNGACMRCLPVALATLGTDLPHIVTASRAQAHTTHHNELSDAGTETVIRMVQAGVKRLDPAILSTLYQDLIDRHPKFRIPARRRVENPSGYIVETLQVVFDALFSCPTFEEGMVDVVNRGGDADTTGAIYGMIAGALHGIDAIPLRWRKALDRDIYLACEQQALRLLRIAPVTC